MSGLIWVGDEEDLRVKHAHSMLILLWLGGRAGWREMEVLGLLYRIIAYSCCGALGCLVVLPLWIGPECVTPTSDLFYTPQAG